MATGQHQVVIIGSGPAGWTAALYTARANLKPIVFEGAAPNLPGGQLMWTSEVENFPGFPHGIKGPEMMAKFKEQAERFGTVSRQENIASVDMSKRPFVLVTEGGETVTTDSLIIATGATAKLLPHALRHQGHARAPTRRISCEPNHARARSGKSEDPLHDQPDPRRDHG